MVEARQTRHDLVGASWSAMKLTPRTQQVADLLLQGCSNSEIAKQLGIARRTVKSHMAWMFARAGLSDATGLKRVKLAVILYRQSQ
jgi:DNA-binding NarL/FixJ family response regulator